MTKIEKIEFENEIYEGEVKDGVPHGKGKIYKDGKFVQEIEFYRGFQVIVVNTSTKKKALRFVKIISEDELKHFKDWEIITLQVAYYKDLNKLLSDVSKIKIEFLDLFIGVDLMQNPHDKKPWYDKRNPNNTIDVMRYFFSEQGFNAERIKEFRKIDIRNLSTINKIHRLKISLYPFVSNDLEIFECFDKLFQLNVNIYSSKEKKFELDLSKLNLMGKKAGINKQIGGGLNLFLPRFPEEDFISLETMNIECLANLKLYGSRFSKSVLKDIESITNIKYLSTLTISEFENIEKFDKLLLCKDLKKIYLDKLLIEKIDKKLISEFNKKQVEVLPSDGERYFT